MTINVNRAGGAGGYNPTDSGVDPSKMGDMEVPDEKTLEGGDQKYYFNLMQKMQAESRAFEAMTNILKARDEAAKSAIQNIGH